jgi:SAM-dependent methyltransferase
MLSLPNKILLHACKYLPLPQKMKWRIGMKDEIAFWEGYIASNYAPVNGVPPSEEGRQRCDPGTPLSGELARLVDHVPGPVIRVLDVGSGPLSRVGKTLPGKQVELHCVDPLADVYAALCKKHGVNVPVAVLKGEAEHIDTLFPPRSFDLIHANNCLDHSHDPVLAISKVFELLKPGCSFYLRHEENVADAAGYMGLHQWNFSIIDGSMIIAGRHGSTNMNSLLAGQAEIKSHKKDKFVVHIITRLS